MLTDNEIMQALDYCDRMGLGHCNSWCPMFYNGTNSKKECMQKLCRCAFDLIKRQQVQIERLKDALGTAMDCIADCEYSLTKVCNSRVEVAINDWNEYVENNDVYSLIREAVGEER